MNYSQYQKNNTPHINQTGFYSQAQEVNKNYVKWNSTQNQAYIIFLCQNYDNFKNQHSRRSKKVHNRLAQCVKTRSDIQCKSHHQKMMKNYKTIEDICQEISHRNGRTPPLVAQFLNQRKKKADLTESSNQTQKEEPQNNAKEIDNDGDIFDDVLIKFYP